MLFNSHIYIFLFLPLTVLGYFLLNRFKWPAAADLFLVGASLFFYSWWNWRYLPLLIGSFTFNFFIGSLVARRTDRNELGLSHRKFLLIFGIAVNLCLLGFFKYMDFFISNFNLMAGKQFGLLTFALPLAISFFTFQQIAYLVDSYIGEAKDYRFVNYIIFVTFFPQLIAGPIVHHKEMMGQFVSAEGRFLNWGNIYAGLLIFSMGLFKKIFVADTFAIWATAGFDHAASLNFMEAWIASFSYTLQIYFDFSGYTDMAIGSALFFNIRLPQNFNSPYKALDIQDFWRRWHMTLSRWLRDYLFIPLGGSRCGKAKIYRNLMITFLLGGLWHGAGWTFIIWGALHGTAAVIHRVWTTAGFKMPAWLAWPIMILFINATWIFFRAKDFASAAKVFRGMADIGSIEIYKVANILPGGHVVDILPWLAFFFFVASVIKNSNQYIQNPQPSFRWTLVALILLLMGMPDVQQPSEFLYFNF